MIYGIRFSEGIKSDGSERAQLVLRMENRVLKLNLAPPPSLLVNAALCTTRTPAHGGPARDIASINNNGVKVRYGYVYTEASQATVRFTRFR